MYTEKEILAEEKRDGEAIAAKWERLGDILSELSDRESAEKILSAFREYYREMLSPRELTEWVAGLYDVGTGGFYYSNSARDNEGFLPDLESTTQALGWFHSFSLGADLGREISEYYPDWMKESLVRFIKEKQDLNGYFYHPQWTAEETDKRPHRRGRDLTWATRMLAWLGEAPTYDTPNGVKGSGIGADGKPVADYTPSGGCAAPSEERVTPELKDRESFEKFLSGLDVTERSWHVGNLLESICSQIEARDKRLCELGADYRLSDILAEWLAKSQSPKTGLWGNELCCYTVNGLLKIGAAFSKIRKPIPHIAEGIRSAIAVIEGDEQVTNVCDVLNPWYALNVMIGNVKDFGGFDDTVSECRRYVFLHAPEMIRKTKERLLGFKKPDGSFSYQPEFSAHISQGMPVAVYESREGDVNATMIATRAVVTHIFDLLGVRRIPLFGEADRMRFINTVEAAHSRG